MCNIISPSSLLLSATGTLAFKNCGLSDDVSTFTAPEMLQGPVFSKSVPSRSHTSIVIMSLHSHSSQPVQLSDHLNNLLLSMCEDQAHRRVTLNTILEACESQHKATILPSPTKVIRQLVEEVFHESVSLDIYLQYVPVRKLFSFFSAGHCVCWMLYSNCGVFSASEGQISRAFREKKAFWMCCCLKSLYYKCLFCQALGPEFIRMADEQHIVLELPGSIVSRKGRSCSSQREVTVVLPNGQYVVVRCDIKSKARDVFDMVVAHANLVEHFYFGLAFIDDDEYFFLDHETKISKVSPDSWKKGQISSFLVFLRVKFYVDDMSFILHKLTRHQYYLQLRRDLLEDRLHCNEETGLFLAALALQAEFGDYMPEVQRTQRTVFPLNTSIYFQCVLHHAQILPEEAETEYLKIAQQLQEYGVLFHRVGREKRPVMGELVLGVCSKGIIVYEMKNHLRTVTRRFLWRETDTISTGVKINAILCGGPSGKKHSFVTESSKIAQYLLNLCSAQHKFHSEMTSRQLNHTMIPGGSNWTDCAELIVFDFGNTDAHKVDTPTRTPPEREIVCVTLKKDPKLGFGFVIVGEDNTGKLDLGIFIASIVPDGPADKDGRIKSGGRLISLNKTSLEGVIFSDAAAILQNSPEEVELIVSQPKRKICSMHYHYKTLLVELNTACMRSFIPHRCFPIRVFEGPFKFLEYKYSRSPSIWSLKTGERFIVELKKNSGSLGISVAGGINTNVRYGGIYIKSLVIGGAAEQDRRIQIGDRLLEVDGSNLRGVTHHQAVECLKRTGEPTVVLEPRPDSPCPPLAHSSSHSHPPLTEVSMETTLSCRAKDYSFVTDENTLEVVLKKSLSGLGFSFNISQLHFGPDRGSVVRIKRLFPGQPALESGLLREGDVILSVNKEPVKDLSYQRVLFLLRGTPSEVHLLICRPGYGALYDVDDNTLVSSHVRKTTASSLSFIMISKYLGVREEADGSVTYCLMGNGLTIMADEEYLTISSTLEPLHNLPSSLATHTPTTNLTGLHSQTSNSSSGFSSQNPSLGLHVPSSNISALSLSSDTPTTCTLARPSQPPKAKHHPIQQGLLPSHYKAISINSRHMVPPPQPPAPPLTPITAQVVPSVPACASPPAPRLPPSMLLLPAQSHTQLREEPEKKGREYNDDYDDDDEEEEEESRRKVLGSLYLCQKKNRYYPNRFVCQQKT
uniref:FERM and PDZ domain containing 2 n=1 Tax=Cyclopterus lumpus TaxID=8103 RepID=A0A8C2WU68_CYCLU